MKRITLRIPDDLHEFIRKQAFETKESINNIILDLLVDAWKKDMHKHLKPATKEN